MFGKRMFGKLMSEAGLFDKKLLIADLFDQKGKQMSAMDIVYIRCPPNIMIKGYPKSFKKAV